jgi:hypothetical protein
VSPRTITVDKNPAYPCTVAEMKEDGELWRFARLRGAVAGVVGNLGDVVSGLFNEP